jgi:hypothetical protein
MVAHPDEPTYHHIHAPEARRYTVTGGSMRIVRIAAAALVAIALAFAGAMASAQLAAADTGGTTNITHDV